MTKIKNIEIYRFLFALVICYLHMIINWTNIYPGNEIFSHYRSVTLGGYAVNFFFIISGFFLFYSLLKTESIVDFVIKKVKRLFPVMCFSLVLICALKVFFLNQSFKWSELAYDLMFLQSTAIPATKGINVAAWYVSALLIVSTFYALIVKNFKKYSLFIILICTFCGLSYLAKNGGVVTELKNIFLTTGTIRGIAFIGLGYLTAAFLQRKGENLNAFLGRNWLSKILTTLFEISATGLIFYYITIGKNLTTAKTLIAFIFVGLFICLILRQGYLSKFLDNNVSAFLGKYAYSIYLMQAVFNVVARKIVWTKENYGFMSEHFALAIIFNILCYIFFGVVTYHVIENPPQRLKNLAKRLYESIAKGSGSHQ